MAVNIENIRRFKGVNSTSMVFVTLVIPIAPIRKKPIFNEMLITLFNVFTLEISLIEHDTPSPYGYCHV